MFKLLKSSQKGFTLVELIVVIAIIVVFLVVGTTGYTTRIRESDLKKDADLIANELSKIQQDVISRNVFGYTTCNHNGISLYGYSLPNSTYNVVLHCGVVNGVGITHNIREGTLNNSYIVRTEPFVQVYFPYPFGVLLDNEQIIIHHNTANRCVNLNTGPYTPVTVSDPYDC